MQDWLAVPKSLPLHRLLSQPVLSSSRSKKEFCWAESADDRVADGSLAHVDARLSARGDVAATSLPVLPASIKMPSVLLVSLTPRTFPLPLQSGTAPKSGPEVRQCCLVAEPATMKLLSAFELRSAEAAKRWRGWDQWIGLPN